MIENGSAVDHRATRPCMMSCLCLQAMAGRSQDLAGASTSSERCARIQIPAPAAPDDVPFQRACQRSLERIADEVQDMLEANGIPWNQEVLLTDLFMKSARDIEQQVGRARTDWWFVQVYNVLRNPVCTDRDLSQGEHMVLCNWRRAAVQDYRKEVETYHKLLSIPRFAREGFPPLRAVALASQPPAQEPKTSPSPTACPAVGSSTSPSEHGTVTAHLSTSLPHPSRLDPHANDPQGPHVATAASAQSPTLPHVRSDAVGEQMSGLSSQAPMHDFTSPSDRRWAGDIDQPARPSTSGPAGPAGTLQDTALSHAGPSTTLVRSSFEEFSSDQLQPRPADCSLDNNEAGPLDSSQLSRGVEIIQSPAASEVASLDHRQSHAAVSPLAYQIPLPTSQAAAASLGAEPSAAAPSKGMASNGEHSSRREADVEAAGVQPRQTSRAEARPEAPRQAGRSQVSSLLVGSCSLELGPKH